MKLKDLRAFVSYAYVVLVILYYGIVNNYSCIEWAVVLKINNSNEYDADDDNFLFPNPSGS